MPRKGSIEQGANLLALGREGLKPHYHIKENNHP